VPWRLSVQLAGLLRSSDVATIVVKDGDHRLSRDGDIRLLIATVQNMLADVETAPLPNVRAS
jgi:hypothetical protein